jgi:hypothetical protein
MVKFEGFGANFEIDLMPLKASKNYTVKIHVENAIAS